MSIEWAAYALVGVTFSLDGFVTKKNRPSCPHAERRGHKFCPVCGKPVLDEVDKDYDKYEEVRNIIEKSLGESWYLTPKHKGIDFLVLGFGTFTSLGKHERIWPLPSMEEIRVTIRAILEPHGLWEDAEPTFGLHSVTVGG